MQQSQSLLRSAKRVVVNINIYDYITVILDGRIKSDDICLMFQALGTAQSTAEAEFIAAVDVGRENL